MPLDGGWSWVSDNRSGINRLSAIDRLVKHWMHCVDCGPVVRSDEATNVDMPFTRCTKEEIYASHLAMIIRENMALANATVSFIVSIMSRSRVFSIQYVS